MKKLLKLFLALGMVFCGAAQAEENRFYWLAHGWFNFNRHAAAIIVPLVTIGKTLYLGHTIAEFPDVPEAVAKFCHERLQNHDINPETIVIKIRQECSVMETFPGAILFNPAAAQQLNNALTNPTDAESVRVLGVYSTFLDHEIGHLQHNDVPKRIAVLTSATIASYLATSYLMASPHLEQWFKKPENLKEFFITFGAHSVATGINQSIIKYITSWYSHYQERNADAYAIAHSNNATALRAAANSLEKIDSGMIEFVCENAELNPTFSMSQRGYLIFMRTMLKTLYQAEHAQDEDFRTWVTKQTDILEDMRNIADPEHPSGFSRAQTMRAAADALEAQAQIPLAA